MFLRKGLNIEIPKEWDGTDETILVEGKELWEFVNDMSDTRHELFRHYTFLITRIFDARVKSLVKNILMGKGKDKIPIAYFSYRVEFQARGMPHIHGVAWIEKDWLAEKGITGYLSDHLDDAVAIANELISCELADGTKVGKIVKEVQKHGHTKSCRKYNGSCRYGFPKLPCLETFMAEPLSDDIPEEIKTDMLKKATEVLKTARDFLNSDECDDEMTYEDFLQAINTSKEDYENSIRISDKGRVLVLKRSVKERFINNYNREMIIAWNANMDIQLALDPYAIVSYIVNYVSKDESGMTSFLKEALNDTGHLEVNKKLKALKEAYLTHRQMGASEAVYRVIPSMRLKDSNITCTFVTTGFPEKRSYMYKKVKDDNDDNEGEESEDEDENVEDGDANEKTIKLEGQKGRYKQATTMIDRYAKRPSELENMCYAQFSTSYNPVKNPPKTITFENGVSSKKSAQTILNTEEPLPEYIDLSSDELGFLKLRSFPSVMRIHSSKKKEGHEQHYSELLLFYPWRDEINEFHREDSDLCKSKYHQCKAKIDEIRQLFYPGDATLELMDSNDFVEKKPCHIYDKLDGQGQQENEDDNVEGIIDDPAYESFGYRGNLNQEDIPFFESFKYKKVCLPSTDEMNFLTRRLVPEQLNVLRKVMRFCKKVLRYSYKVDPRMHPKPIRLIVTGGAGVGKSALITAIEMHVEKILRKAGTHPNHPRILLCAPTGKAASLIKGTTLHSAFHFKFGNEHVSLSDKKRAEFQEHLRHLKIVVVDEMSMVGADMLYKLHLRLSEDIFQNKELFGGISVILVGDLLQLPPVKASYIFATPKNKHFAAYHEINPLWNTFEPMILRHNHRQGEGEAWANTLNLFRKGIVTQEHEELLRGRETSNDSLNVDTLNVCYTNKEVEYHNDQMLNALESPVISVQAEICVPKGCRPVITDHGTIDNTRFMNVLNLKLNSRCVLIFNVNTLDGLANGESGTIVGIELNSKQQVDSIIVNFDNKSCGSDQRLKYPTLSKKYRDVNGTPIKRIEFEYQKTSRKGFSQAARSKVYQFPLQMNYASTAHRIQGTTVKSGSKVLIHWSSRFKNHSNAGIGYVCLGRSERLSDVYIKGQFDSAGIHCSSDALAETERLEQIFDNYVKKEDDKKGNHWKLSYLNVSSLRCHQHDVSIDNFLIDSDIFSLGETRLPPGEMINFERFDGCSAGFGEGKGIAAYSKIDLITEPNVADSEKFSAIQMKTKFFAVIFLYLSKGFDQQKLFDQLDVWIDTEKPTAVMGDVNWNYSDETNMKKFMLEKGFEQLIKKPTFDRGTLIDHVYVNQSLIKLNITAQQDPAYYTDHDIVSLFIPKQ